MADWQGWSQFILALVGVGGLVSAHILNKRGTKAQAAQQVAANQLASRAQGFDEMESIVERLTTEATRIEQARERDRAEVIRVRGEYDKALESQARRCRTTLDHFVLAFTTLQGVVVSETAKREAEKAQVEVEQHLAEDHPGAGEGNL